MTVQEIYNSLNDTSVLSMFPFLILSPTDKFNNFYQFLQYKGRFYSKQFHMGDFKLKEFTWLTPYRYFVNKKIFNQIEIQTRLHNYEPYVSFKNPYTLRVSLYHKDTVSIRHYTIKLFSGMIDFKFADFYTYWFKMNRQQRIEYRIQKLQKKTELLQKKAQLPEVESLKSINQETKELINTIKQKHEEEEQKKDEKRKEKKIEDTMTEERKRQQQDIEKMSHKDYNKSQVVIREDIDLTK